MMAALDRTSSLERTSSAGERFGEGFPARLVGFMSSTETALKFINLLLNDTVYVFEDSIMQLKKVKELEAEEAALVSLKCKVDDAKQIPSQTDALRKAIQRTVAEKKMQACTNSNIVHVAMRHLSPDVGTC